MSYFQTIFTISNDLSIKDFSGTKDSKFQQMRSDRVVKIVTLK